MVLPFHRSFQDTYRRCARLAWYTYLQDGDGVEPEELNLGLHLGSSGHRGMEVLFLTGGNLDAAIGAAISYWREGQEGRPLFREAAQHPEFFQAEQEALLTAFLIAWKLQFWDQFNNEYGIEKIEREFLSPEGLQTRCDLIGRSRWDQAIYVLDWKFVKDAKDWAQKYTMEPQTWAQQHGVKEGLGEPVAGSIYWAFIKGDRRKNPKSGRTEQLSYLIYGYKKQLSTGQWTFSCEYESAKGWEKFPVWEEETIGADPLSRLVFWLNWLPEEVRAAQFCQSPPLLPNAYLTQEWLQEAATIMEHVEQHRGDMKRFPRSPSNWNCGGCWARKACEKGVPFTGGRRRVPHHPKVVLTENNNSSKVGEP